MRKSMRPYWHTTCARWWVVGAALWRVLKPKGALSLFPSTCPAHHVHQALLVLPAVGHCGERAQQGKPQA